MFNALNTIHYQYTIAGFDKILGFVKDLMGPIILVGVVICGIIIATGFGDKDTGKTAKKILFGLVIGGFIIFGAEAIRDLILGFVENGITEITTP